MEVLVLLLCLVISSIQTAAPVAAAVGLRPPAMYVLGDSLLDVGNNNYLTGADVPRANKPYYGVDFPGGKPTGRFSNGYNTADYIAKSMGFASSPPPYLSLLADNSSSSSRIHAHQLVLAALTNGVSYASADAGILDSTNAGKCIPLSTQLRYFNATRAEMVAAVGSVAVSALLSKSIFLIGVGSNDMFVFAAAEQQSDAAALYASLISNYSATITQLHSMGARKFAVINVGEVGCVPTVRVLDAAGQCADGLNRLAADFDDALRQLLVDLAARLPGLVYSLADSFALSRDTFADPQAAGYTDIAAACCGSGRLLAEADCLPNSTLCGNRDGHVFWDRYHPAQRACLLTAQAFYDGPAQYTTPINFMQLAQSS
ncbi:hypothetical protein U9M48_030374 [Paspalum notatum var. saurae]|uniref:GDSL esterase/lipase n=1 Tax=Paspalum notatum var. saurae TaxID=547442 RepID=A0AAQ3U009_PASNO